MVRRAQRVDQIGANDFGASSPGEDDQNPTDVTARSRSRMSKLTLLIPTRDRPFLLSKTLSYYELMGCRYPIMIGDASEPDGYRQNQLVIRRHERRLEITHCRLPPGFPTHPSIVELLQKVVTPYSVFSGDDDFLVPSHLQKCVDFLDAHPDCSFARGTEVRVYVTGLADGHLTIENVSLGAHRNLQQDRPSERLIEWVSRSIARERKEQTTFSVQRTKEMIYNWQEAARVGLDSARAYDILYELSCNVLSIVQGKAVCLPGLYHVMPRHLYRRPTLSAFEVVTQWNWSVQIANMIAWWATEISKREEIEYERAHDIAQAVFFSWLIGAFTRYRDWRLTGNGLLPEAIRHQNKTRIRQLIGDLPGARRAWRALKRHNPFLRWNLSGENVSLAAFRAGRSAYHSDFAPIYQILTRKESWAENA